MLYNFVTENDGSLEELDNPVSAEAKECTSVQVHPPVQDQSSNIVVAGTKVLYPRKEAVHMGYDC